MKKNKLLLLVLLVGVLLGSPNHAAKAETLVESAQNKVEQALRAKNFYAFNMAYADIMKMPDSTERINLLVRLATISGEVWTPQVKKSVELLENLCKLKDGRSYDETEIYLRSLKETEMDTLTQGYLLGELTSWGKNFVFTEDYAVGLKALLEVADYKDIASANRAASAISEVKNELSKAYLSNELDSYKKAFNIVEKPLPPEWVIPKVVSNSKIRVKWSQVEGADYYHLYYSFDPEAPFKYFESEYGGKKRYPWKEKYSAELYGLKSRTTIYLKVTSVKNGVESDFSAMTGATTLADGDGSLNSPLSLVEAQKFMLQDKGSEAQKKVSLKLLEIYSGEYAGLLVSAKDSSNPMPKNDEQWIFMKFKLKNLSEEGEPIKPSAAMSKFIKNMWMAASSRSARGWTIKSPSWDARDF